MTRLDHRHGANTPNLRVSAPVLAKTFSPLLASLQPLTQKGQTPMGNSTTVKGVKGEEWTLTLHAQQRAEERGISLADIKDTLRHSEVAVAYYDGERFLYKRNGVSVICSKSGHVLTVVRTSPAKTAYQSRVYRKKVNKGLGYRRPSPGQITHEETALDDEEDSFARLLRGGLAEDHP